MQEALRQWLLDTESEFKQASNPVRAAGEQAYLKSELCFMGTGVPFIRSTAKRFRTRFPGLSREELLEVVRALWATPVHEFRSLGIAILEVYRDRLEFQNFELLEDLLRRSDTWAHVDWLAVKVAGFLVSRCPEAVQLLDRWSRDSWMWLRRAALLSLLEPLRAGGGDFATFSRFASGMLGEKDFFIRKAIGWILRDISRKRPELTEAFLNEHLHAVSGLTFREGSRHLPEPAQQLLRARYDQLRGRRDGC